MMYNYQILWLLLLIILFPIVNSQSLAYPSQTCPASQLYFSATSMTCQSCSSLNGGNYIFTSTSSSSSSSSLNTGGCKCANGYYNAQVLLDASSSRYGVGCLPCPTGTISSRDRSFCLSCSNGLNNAIWNAAKQTCGCPDPDMILVDRDASGLPLNATRCIYCQSNAYPSTDKSTCVSCPDPMMVAVRLANNVSYSCNCPSGYTAANQGRVCLFNSFLASINSAYPSSQVSSITYYSISTSPLSVTSDYFNDYFTSYAVGCTYLTNDTNCQGLANLCVMLDYDTNHASCKLYTSLAKARPGPSGNPDWPVLLPWLLYGINSGENPSVTLAKTLSNTNVGFGTTSSTSISTTSSSSSGSLVTQLNMVLAKYAWNGTFLGYEKMFDQVQLCKDSIISSNQWLKIGYAQQVSCSINLKSLVDTLISSGDGTFFYDPYVIDGTGSLQSVIVRNLNFRSYSSFSSSSSTTSSSTYTLVNQNSQNSDDYLTRRFFILDVTSSKSKSTGLPNVVRYLSTFNVIIQKGEGVSGKILVPIIEVGYTEKLYSTLSSTDTGITTSLSVIFGMDVSNYFQAITILFSLVCLMVAIFWLYLSFIQIQRLEPNAEKRQVNSSVLLRSFFIFCQCTSAGLFFILVIGTFYWFVIFKGQTVVFAFLPSSAASAGGGASTTSSSWFLNLFNQMLVLTTVLKGIAVLERVHRQCKADVFFMDWEKSKGQTIDQYGREKNVPVSVWRTLFAANQWNELACYRRVSVNWTLFGMLIFQLGFNLRNLAIARATSSDLSSAGPISPILLFPLNVLFFYGLILVQRTFQYLFRERFFGHPILQFVDLLSISNLSLLVLDEPYHGFYVHGRSVHPFADTDMFEMSEALRKESSGLLALRGLHDSDQQTFEVFLAKPIKQLYDRMFRSLVMDQALRTRNVTLATNNNNNTTNSRLSNNSNPAADEGSPGNYNSVLKAYQTMNKFWCYFIDRDLKDHPYHIREKTFIESTFLLVPETGGSHSVFFNDPELMISRRKSSSGRATSSGTQRTNHGSNNASGGGGGGSGGSYYPQSGSHGGSSNNTPCFADCTLYGLEWNLLAFYCLLYNCVDVMANSANWALVSVFLIDRAIVIYRTFVGRQNVALKSLVDERFLF